MADRKNLGEEESHRDIQYRVSNPKGQGSRGRTQRVEAGHESGGSGKQGMIPEGRGSSRVRTMDRGMGPAWEEQRGREMGEH